MKNKLNEAIEFANTIYEDYVGENRDREWICNGDEDCDEDDPCTDECRYEDEIIDSYSLRKSLNHLIMLLEEINNEVFNK